MDAPSPINCDASPPLHTQIVSRKRSVQQEEMGMDESAVASEALREPIQAVSRINIDLLVHINLNESMIPTPSDLNYYYRSDKVVFSHHAEVSSLMTDIQQHTEGKTNSVLRFLFDPDLPTKPMKYWHETAENFLSNQVLPELLSFFTDKLQSIGSDRSNILMITTRPDVSMVYMVQIQQDKESEANIQNAIQFVAQDAAASQMMATMQSAAMAGMSM